MNRLRAAVIGVGHLGRHHARILASMPDVELVAVVDSRIDRARSIADEYGTRALDDPHALIGAVDAVSIAAPTCFHRDAAIPFLERGTATLVEKPLAGSLADAEAITAAARAGGAVLQVGHIERFNPVLTGFQQNSIHPRYVTAERLSTHTFRSTDIGVVLDLMIHDLDLLLSMNRSAVRSVAAVGLSLFGQHEDVANARVEFEDGCVANLTASRASYAAVRKMCVWGEEGYAALDFAARQATVIRPSERLRRGNLDLNGVDLTQIAAVREHLFGTALEVSTNQYEGREPLALELEDFIRAARGLGSPRVDGDEALRSIRLADQILRSLRSHRWTADGASLAFDRSQQPVDSIYQGPHAWQSKGSQPAPAGADGAVRGR